MGLLLSYAVFLMFLDAPDAWGTIEEEAVVEEVGGKADTARTFEWETKEAIELHDAIRKFFRRNVRIISPGKKLDTAHCFRRTRLDLTFSPGAEHARGEENRWDRPWSTCVVRLNDGSAFRCR